MHCASLVWIENTKKSLIHQYCKYISISIRAIRTCRDCGLLGQKASKSQSTPKSSAPDLPEGAKWTRAASRCWLVLVAICCMNSQHIEGSHALRQPTSASKTLLVASNQLLKCIPSFKQILRDFFLNHNRALCPAFAEACRPQAFYQRNWEVSLAEHALQSSQWGIQSTLIWKTWKKHEKSCRAGPFLGHPAMLVDATNLGPIATLSESPPSHPLSVLKQPDGIWEFMDSAEAMKSQMHPNANENNDIFARPQAPVHRKTWVVFTFDVNAMGDFAKTPAPCRKGKNWRCRQRCVLTKSPVAFTSKAFPLNQPCIGNRQCSVSRFCCLSKSTASAVLPLSATSSLFSTA